MLQDGFQAAVGQRVDVDGPLACRLQTAFTVSPGEAQNAQATAVALLRMAALMQDVFDDRFDVRADTPGPVHQPRRIPALNGLMGRGHVRIHRRVPAAKGTAQMAGDAASAVKQFDRRAGGADIHFLPGETVGHRVVMVVELNVIVDADRRDLPFSEFVTRFRQGRNAGRSKSVKALSRDPGSF